ncbi:MAG: hypothetical protein ACFCVF_05905 [Kineosporiaceae bacterium]
MKAAAVLALLVALVAAAEIGTRILLDDAVRTAADVGLRQSSTGSGGFADVAGDARGWALPDLVRGRLSGMAVEATDGELGGLPVSRLTGRTGAVDLRTREAEDVVVVATTDPRVLLDLAGELTGADLSGGSVAVVSADTLRFSGEVAGTPLVADVQVAPDGAGGLTGSVLSVEAAGLALDPSLLPRTEAVLLGPADIPPGFAVTDATAGQLPDGAPVLQVTLECPDRCVLTGAG